MTLEFKNYDALAFLTGLPRSDDVPIKDLHSLLRLDHYFHCVKKHPKDMSKEEKMHCRDFQSSIPHLFKMLQLTSGNLTKDTSVILNVDNVFQYHLKTRQ